MVEVVLELVIAGPTREAKPLPLILALFVRSALTNKVIIIMCMPAIFVHLVLFKLVQEAGSSHVLLVIIFRAVHHSAGSYPCIQLIAFHAKWVLLGATELSVVLLIMVISLIGTIRSCESFGADDGASHRMGGCVTPCMVRMSSPILKVHLFFTFCIMEVLTHLVAPETLLEVIL